MAAPVANPLTRAVVVVVALCATAGLPIWFAAPSDHGDDRPAPVRFPSAVVTPPAGDLAGMVARSLSAAEGRIQVALTLGTSEITAIVDRTFTGLAFEAESVAGSIATYNRCVKLVAMLASDQVRGRSDAREWVQERIEERIDPQIATCEREIQAAIDWLDRELTASTLTMATELAAIGGSGSVTAAPNYADGLASLTLDAALGKLGFKGAFVPPTIALDIYALMHTRLGSSLVTTVVDAVKWIFARPLAAAVTEAGLVVVDGPLPFGDLLAAAGVVWTAYDIHSLRYQFEKELTAAIRESLPEVRRDMEQRILATLRERMASHTEFQARIHDETAREVFR